MGAPEATALVRADNRKLRGDLSKSRKMFGKTFRGVGRRIKSSLSTALSPLGVGLGVLGIASIGKGVLDFEDKLNRLKIQSGASAEEIGKFRATLVALSKDTGISRQELIGAVDELVNLTGAAGFSSEKLAILAKANLATGAAMKDLAGLTFSLEKAFGIVDPSDLEQGLSSIIEAGKQGAIPLNQMATVLQTVAASFRDVSGAGAGGVADLASALQVLRGGGFASATEAGTGLQALLTKLTKNAAKLRKAGVEVFETKDGVKQFKSIRDILDSFEQSKLIRDPEALGKALGSVEALKALKALRRNRGEFERISDAAKKSDSINSDAEERRRSNAFRLQKAMNNLKETIARLFTPERLESFVGLMEKLGGVVEFIVDNIKVFAAVVAGIKIAGLISSMGQLATATAKASGNASGLGSAFSKIGASLGAFSVGFGLGTILDQALGISDAISDALVDTSRINFGFLRDRARDLATAAGQRGGEGPGDEVVPFPELGLGAGASFGGIGDKPRLSDERIFSDARATVRQAKEAGIIEKRGGISRGAALEATGGRAVEANELIAAVETAQRLVEQSQKAFAQGIDVRITVDQEGRLTTTSDPRRSSQ